MEATFLILIQEINRNQMFLAEQQKNQHVRTNQSGGLSMDDMIEYKSSQSKFEFFFYSFLFI